MRHADLSPFTQFLLMGVLTIALMAVLGRAILFIRREYKGVRPSYPQTWRPAQCRALECFRLLVGVALFPLWGAFLLVSPSMPTNAPFGILEVTSLIILISLSYAWVLLLTPRNWGKFGAFSGSFWLTIAFLIVWWGAMFGVTGWILAKASASPPRLFFSVGVFASKQASPCASRTQTQMPGACGRPFPEGRVAGIG